MQVVMYLHTCIHRCCVICVIILINVFLYPSVKCDSISLECDYDKPLMYQYQDHWNKDLINRMSKLLPSIIEDRCIQVLSNTRST